MRAIVSVQKRLLPENEKPRGRDLFRHLLLGALLLRAFFSHSQGYQLCQIYQAV